MSQDPGSDTYLMLVRANVLRLRRQYELAEAQCSEALRREPDNAAAHSVLGDIARDQGKLRDAIEWYKMALDRDPGNISDRKKLEAVIDQVYSGEKTKVLQRLQQGVSGALESTASEIRAARLPSMVTVTLTAMLGVIMAVTIIVLVLGRGGSPAPAPAAMPPAGGFSAPQAPSLEPIPVASAAAADEPRFGEDVGPTEEALKEEMVRRGRMVDPNCRVSRTEIDPRDGAVTIQLAMPRLWSSQNTRRSMARVSVPLALAAAAWDERLSRVRIRCTAYQQGQPDRLAFVGEATSEELARAPSDSGALEPEQVFSSVWWDPELTAPAAAPPAPGGR